MENVCARTESIQDNTHLIKLLRLVRAFNYESALTLEGRAVVCGMVGRNKHINVRQFTCVGCPVHGVRRGDSPKETWANIDVDGARRVQMMLHKQTSRRDAC